MDPRSFTVLLALASFAAPALAADIDDVTAGDLALEVPDTTPGVQERSRSSRTVQRGNKTATVRRGSNDRGKSRTTVHATNGRTTVHGARGRNQTTQTQGNQTTTHQTTRGVLRAENQSGHTYTQRNRRDATRTVTDHGNHSHVTTSARSRHQVVDNNPRTGVRSVTQSANARPATTRTTSTTRPSTGPSRGSRPVASGHTRPASAGHTRPVTRTTTVRSSGRVVHTAPRRTVVYRRVTPVHGVFVYGPPVRHHHHYHTSSATSTVRVQQAHLPERAVDRDDTLAIGLKAGSLLSGTETGQLYGDLGLGLMGRYRPAESVGLQLDLSHHAGESVFNGSSSVRNQTQVAGSVALFAFPWTRVSPYALGGVTWNARSLHDEYYGVESTTLVGVNDALWGLHGGLGLELALGDSFALDLEGRYVGWLDRGPVDPLGAIQGTAGLTFHFR